MTDIKKLLSELTLEEKASLTSGEGFWLTKAVERLGIGSARTSDGPHGLRADDYSREDHATMPAVCFPAAVTTAASFDREMLRELGEELGRECLAYGVDVLLGPGINIKRSPLCGRNFEYFSEDPYLAGQLGEQFVKGVQSQGVGTSLKHFFANSQETRRFTSSSDIDERAIREIYLAAFENVVKKAQPWTIMASYNKINGTYSTANRYYIDEVLRREWGFEGLVVSDWGATHDRVGAIEAGTDLTMPAEKHSDRWVAEAVKSGRLSEKALDRCCERVLRLVEKAENGRVKNAECDKKAAHALARKFAANSLVLLKNEGGLLPLKKTDKVAFIGAFAENPRLQGGGSSHIRETEITGALGAAREAGINVIYAAGYDRGSGETDDVLICEAVEAARSAEKAVVFIGLPDSYESEGGDRKHMRLPEAHNRLVREVCAANPDTAVVLHNGSPVEMPWIDEPKAVLEAYLGGQAVGGAEVDILFGDVNPSGRLAESFPKRLEDNPSYLWYFGEGDRVSYNESIFVGYRYYETKKQEVLFPFGYGLSYTEFEYSNLRLGRSEMTEDDTLEVSVDVKNVGKTAGKEVVQLYVAPEKGMAIRPVRELKEFAKIGLMPGETKTVSFKLQKRAFAHWDSEAHCWEVERGNYGIQICKNAHEAILEKSVKMI